MASRVDSELLLVGSLSADSDRPGQPIAARPVYQPPSRRLRSYSRPGTGDRPGRELHIHLRGITAGPLAAIATGSGACLEEDR